MSTQNNATLMEKFQTFMEEKLLPISSKISGQRHMAALRDGMIPLIPLTIIGGLAMIIAIPPVPADLQPTNFFFEFLLKWKEFATANFNTLLAPYQLTIGIISIYVVMGIAYNLAKSYNMDPINNTFSALLTFLLIAAFPANDGVFATAQLGATSMFVALLIGMLVVEINRTFIKHKVYIKLPESVPSNVAAPFNILLPLAFTTILFVVANQICFGATGAGLPALIYKLIQPLLSAADSLPSIIFINILMTTFWFFGIHGNNMVSVVVTPITTAALAMNAEAYANGQPLPAIFAGAVNAVFGNWITYTSLLIVVYFFVKSSQLKSISRIAVFSTMFNINEPLIFGVPTVMNVLTYIPLLICSVLNFSTAYLLMKANIIGRFFVTLPFTVPGPLQAFLATLDWKTIPLWFALLFVDILVLLPFMKTYDKQLLKAEQETEQK